MKRKSKLFIVLPLVFILLIQSCTQASLVSWSNVPEPAKLIQGWLGVFGMLFFIPVIIGLMGDDAG